MESALPNLFLCLHRWASRQDENYCTEALALVLRYLLGRHPPVAVSVLQALAGDGLVVPAEEPAKIDIRTQVGTSEGRPDLEIGWPDHLMVVEVKVEAELRKGQLEGYWVLLRESRRRHTALVLLTRYPPAFEAGDERPDLVVRWYQVAEWLERALRRGEITDEATRFLCEQFVSFLEARNMSIAQVSWQMAEGVRALRSLLDMLEEAAAACRVAANKVSSWDSIGLRLDNKFWVGVTFDEPSKLCFQTERCRIDVAAAGGLGAGAVIEKSWAPGGKIWRRVVELDSEEVHFFARSKVSQMEWLESFLRESLESARRIELPA